MVDLATIQAHARFFDHLVDLIPAKFYHADPDEHVDIKSVKKADRLAVKQGFKAKAKENKRNKLDPDAPATALEVQQARAESAGDGQKPHGLNLSAGSLSRVELKAKLQKKLEAIQQQRIAKDKEATAKQAKEWRQKTLEDNAKQKQKQLQQQQAGSKRKADDSDGEQQPGSKKPNANKNNQQQQKHEQQAGDKQQATQDDSDFQFAKLDFGEKQRPGKGGKKPTKQELLRQAEAKQAAAAAAAASEDGRVGLMQDAWKTALARAEGQKVLDDPKLLRKSLKKEAKRKEKSAKAWQERKAVQQDQQDKKQSKRTDNLQARVDKKLQTKKEKREKKLLRAGFEGRKAGFIGDKPAAAPAK